MQTSISYPLIGQLTSPAGFWQRACRLDGCKRFGRAYSDCGPSELNGVAPVVVTPASPSPGVRSLTCAISRICPPASSSVVVSSGEVAMSNPVRNLHKKERSVSVRLSPFVQSFGKLQNFDLTDTAVAFSNFPQSLLSGVFSVRSCTVLNGLITMSFSSTLQVLKINAVESGISKKTGSAWERHTAECMLLADNGDIECVGRLVIPQAMRETLAVGTFRASFALVVPTFGDAKGDITARLTGLLPVVPVKSSQVAAPARVAA